MRFIICITFLFIFKIQAQENASSAYFQAEDAFKFSNYNKAIQIINTISKNNIHFESAIILKGHCYLQLDSLDRAEETFMDAVKRNNTFSAAFNGLGLVYYYRISDAKTVVKFFTNIFSEADEERAERLFLRALKYDENYSDAKYNLARLYLLMRV